jgi:hypothetical protein
MLHLHEHHWAALSGVMNQARKANQPMKRDKLIMRLPEQKKRYPFFLIHHKQKLARD